MVNGKWKMDNAGIDEEASTNPINPYGISNLFSEQIIKDIAKANKDFKHLILRCFNVAKASPNLTIEKKTKDATYLIKVASEWAVGKINKMYFFETNYPTPDWICIRDYINVMDLADANIKAIEYLDNNASDIFN